MSHPDRDDDLPTAELAVLQVRARLLASARRYFDECGYWEVETPLVSADTVVDAWLEPFVTDWTPIPQDWRRRAEPPRYLQTSPEFAMKRLLIAGAEAIYQICKAFRNGERGGRHNPEFTMIEWYRVGDDHRAQMTVVEELVRTVCTAAEQELTARGRAVPERVRRLLAGPSFARWTYDEAFARTIGTPVLRLSTAELATLAAAQRLTPPPGLAADDRDGWLNFLLAELVEPRLGGDVPVFIEDYPASQAALAVTRTRRDGAEVAERFELYIDGVELCNGYHELADAAVLRSRNAAQADLRARDGFRPLPQESRLLRALERGLPPSAGVALGFDRLVMLAVGARTIDDVIAFPFDRA